MWDKNATVSMKKEVAKHYGDVDEHLPQDSVSAEKALISISLRNISATDHNCHKQVSRTLRVVHQTVLINVIDLLSLRTCLPPQYYFGRHNAFAGPIAGRFSWTELVIIRNAGFSILVSQPCRKG